MASRFASVSRALARPAQRKMRGLEDLSEKIGRTISEPAKDKRLLQEMHYHRKHVLHKPVQEQKMGGLGWGVIGVVGCVGYIMVENARTVIFKSYGDQ